MDNWIWLIPVIYFIVTAVGGAAQKKAKEVAEREREKRSRTTLEPLSQEPPSTPPVQEQLPTAEAPAGKKSADEIAAEIRRMMGLPEPEAPIAQRAEVAESVAEPEPEVIEDPRDRSHGGDLRERMAARDAEGRHFIGLEDRHFEHKESALAGRHIQPHVMPTRTGAVSGAVRVGGRSMYLDLTDMARAFVTAEVLGPPRALRDHEF